MNKLGDFVVLCLTKTLELRQQISNRFVSLSAKLAQMGRVLFLSTQFLIDFFL